MAGLIFVVFFISLLILAVRLITNAVLGKDIIIPIRMLLLLPAMYFLLWCICFAFRRDRAVPLGVDDCFHDWCVMVLAADYPATLGRPARPVYPQGQFILLTVRVSNRARRGGQQPLEPRVILVDDRGREWGYSVRGQAALEVSSGVQAPLDGYLEPRQSVETGLVFDIPKDAKGLKAQIAEGRPFIDMILLPSTRQIVPLP